MKTYDDAQVIIVVKNGEKNDQYKKTIPVQGQSEAGIDDPKFLCDLLGQAMYKIEQQGKQTTLPEHDNENEPSKINFHESGAKDIAPECSCDHYAMRSGQDTCSNSEVASPEDCPQEVRREKKCPFYTGEGPIRSGPPELPPGAPEEQVQEEPQQDAVQEPQEESRNSCPDATGAGTCTKAGMCSYSKEERAEFGCKITPRKKGSKKKETGD